MAKDSGEIVVGSNGSVFVGEVGATEPTDIDTAFDAGEWTELGYTDEDGPTITDGKSVVPIRGWQSFYDLRRIVESREFTVAMVLQQFNGFNVVLALGGGNVADQGGGNYEYSPPAPEDIDERALGIEWQDGDYSYRFIIGKVTVTENVELNVRRTTNTGLPLTFMALGQDGSDVYIFQTNDPSFADVAGS